ncbi:DNA cytosine methyltransferase [Campylobacter sp. VicNov18]|uniref:DNA cytosine methyltransferase n=1 Tax=Campylobacter bilis TaxID=2691918 RepID=UPI001D0E0CB9|nr:DNA cytosine methyltransferase [Campylobacter bilis]MCC8277581.1 DNA cytosine methyltransferase [Campylobacter bilis]MCC8299190.1 DNA cytosine methyltransferase [Campylobacter bilis]MCC8300490.1 DNA cytosine methyltransferase [Campylobacter bilis]MCC8349516.1 DNA cytosine methyltransferase [Campylobacter bilis]MCC8354833.1 DNA cytosine methyltransferase [Campylobacter bilis]
MPSKKSGKDFGSVYARMKWDEPSPTLTTFCTSLGNGRFGHPEQNRAISLKEASLLQTFPTHYDFIDENIGIKTSVISRHIGNAVPPKLGQIIGLSIKKHLKDIDGI